MRAVCLLLLFAFTLLNPASAKDLQSMIETHGQVLDRLEKAFLDREEHFLEDTSESGNRAYGLLIDVHNQISSIDRELIFLYTLMNMQFLVQGEPRMKHARRIVDSQKEYIVKRAASVSRYIETIMLNSRVRDAETNRLLLEARDAIKAIPALIRQ